VTRIVTPGTVTDEALLDERRDTLVVAIHRDGDAFGLAGLELSSGRFTCIEPAGGDELAAELERLKPAEVLVSEDAPLPPMLENHPSIQRLAPWHFDGDAARRVLTAHFATRDLSGFGCETAHRAVGAAGCLLQYVKDTQRAALPHIQSLQLERREDAIVLDAVSRRNLEIVESLSGERGHALVDVLDRTATAMGGRLLRRWLTRPLRDREVLRLRHHCVGALLDDVQAREEARGRLRDIGDIERILSRVALRSARPRDLSQLGRALGALPDLHAALAGIDTPLLRRLLTEAGEFPELARLLERAIVESPPVVLRDGGVIAPDYDRELDELRELSENTDGYLGELEARERERTGVTTLKVGYNRVHGYYIELGRTHAAKVPAEYVRRQTLKSAERYITTELKDFEDRVLSARERALARERRLYEELIERVVEDLAPLQRCAAGLAEIDVLVNLAERAESLDYRAPKLEISPGIRVVAGRHPVVEQVLEAPFVANDLVLDDEARMLVITGPNMGGKSTLMRQTALIVILAHVGSYVPAEEATIGPIDRIFTRIGAGDDLAGGRSTFMVEMIEAANILNNATPESLVLLDEIGRGTSTYDGLSLAWACAAQLLSDVRAFTLFATHYFELTALPEHFEAVTNVHLEALEHGKSIVFMHRVRPGPASQSYGLQVAALAGVPPKVIEEARRVLARLEAEPAPARTERERDQYSLFESPERDRLRAALLEMDIDGMSPREALEALYRLKDLLPR